MLKKIRRFYWSRRDRGQGRQVIMLALVLFISILSVSGLVIRNVVVTRKNNVETGQNNMIVSGTSASVSGEAVSGASVVTESGILPSGGAVEETQPAETPEEIRVDTSGLDSFHGFVTDEAYSVIEGQVVSECRRRGCTSAKKLNYQQTEEGSFDVASFILFSDGSIYRCNYNLKSTAVSIAITDYTEAGITAMHNAELKAEQAVLEKQQKADKKAKAKKKTNGKKAKKKSQKKAGRKKSAGKSRKKTSKKKALKAVGKKKR